jgi:alpha-D-xyloside xylohydrolase
LKIGERQGEYTGMLKSRTFNIIWISKDKPFAFNPEARPHAVISYNGKEIIITKKQ